MPSEVILNDREEKFIQCLLEGKGNDVAAREAGYTESYGYQLRKRLAKYIVDAAQDFLSIHAVKAAKHVVDTLDAEMPNPVKLQAAQSILDRVGVIKKDSVPTTTIKANIFILPEKQQITIDNE
jgi:hypothetical protein